MACLSPARGQCYDGASVMKGAKSGVTKQICDLERRAVSHCNGHSLNLAIYDAIKVSQVAQLMLVMPATNATSECSFSWFRPIKIYFTNYLLRSTICFTRDWTIWCCFMFIILIQLIWSWFITSSLLAWAIDVTFFEVLTLYVFWCFFCIVTLKCHEIIITHSTHKQIKPSFKLFTRGRTHRPHPPMRYQVVIYCVETDLYVCGLVIEFQLLVRMGQV